MIIENIAAESVALRNAQAVLARRLRPCPSTGEGVHRWIYLAAIFLRDARHSEQTACNAIARAVVGCGREVPKSEIEDAVRNAAHRPTTSAAPPWPARNAG